MKFKPPVPIFRIFDEEIAREFYIDFLEFKIDWEHRFAPDMPLYMQVSKGDCLIHLSEHSGDSSPGSSIRIECPEVEDFQKYLLHKKYKNARPGLQTQPWETKEMCMTDPFHNRLIFFKDIKKGKK